MEVSCRTLLGLFTFKMSSDITLTNDIEDLLKILPQLIRENDTVKGAIISALSGVVATREDIKDLIKEMDRRFEAVDRRFEAVDRRFEAVDRRFEQLIAEMHKGFAETRREQLHLRAAIDNLGDRSGRGLQEAVLELMDELLVKEGVSYRDVQRMPLADPEGVVFFPGFSTDVDVVAKNGEVHLFEVKYKADQRDIAHFVRVAQLYERQTGAKPAKLFVVTLEITRKTLRATAQMPVKVIAGSIVE